MAGWIKVMRIVPPLYLTINVLETEKQASFR
jgi:hypothetical protein